MSKLLLRNWEKSENSFFYKNSHLIQKFAADRMNNPVEEHYNIQTFSESGAITDDVTVTDSASSAAADNHLF